MEEEKTIDIVVQEYEQKLEKQKQSYEEKLKEEKENHAKEIREIISGRKIPQENKPTEEQEEKGFFATELEKTKQKLKLK